MFSYNFGSVIFEVYDKELTSDFVNMIRSCEYTKVENESEEYTKMIEEEYKTGYGRYYDLTFMAEAFGWIHVSGGIIIVSGNDEESLDIYKISGLDKKVFDSFFEYGLENTYNG